MTTTLTLPNSWQSSDVGRIVTGPGVDRLRIVAIDGCTAVLAPLRRRDRIRLWLTTAPNGDATRWMQ